MSGICCGGLQAMNAPSLPLFPTGLSGSQECHNHRFYACILNSSIPKSEELLFTWFLSSFVSWSFHSLLPALSSIAQSPRGVQGENLRPGKGAHPNCDERLLFYFVTRSGANSLQGVNEPYHLTKLSLGESSSWSGVVTPTIMFPCSSECVRVCWGWENVLRNLCRGYIQDSMGRLNWRPY